MATPENGELIVQETIEGSRPLKASLFVPDALLDSSLEIRENQALLCEGDTITRIGPAEELRTEARKASFPVQERRLPGRLLLPGTINAHNHSFQSLLRGVADDRPFLVWRDEALYKYAPLLGTQGVYQAALFAFAEMIQMGITTVCDFFYIHGAGIETDLAIRRAAQDVGIRLVIARTLYDWDGAPDCFQEDIKDAVRSFRELHEEFKTDPKASTLPAPHSPHGASPEMIQAGAELARELNIPWHMHLAEEPFELEEIEEKWGTTPVGFLEKFGCVDERLCIVHGVHLPDRDIEILGSHGVGLLHCPSSNMFLGDGAAPLMKMMDAGMRPALGSDGGCSNNRVSVFEEMRMASLLQKVIAQDGATCSAELAFQMGTKGGADLCNIKAGALEVGRLADMVAIDLEHLSMQPPAHLLRNTVYSMQPGAITHVFVGGEEVLRQGRLTRIPEREVVAQIRALCRRIKLKAV